MRIKVTLQDSYGGVIPLAVYIGIDATYLCSVPLFKTVFKPIVKR